jgi:hypothetical protein
MEEKRGIKNFEATHSGGDRADAEEACYTANRAIASTKHRQRQNLRIHYAIASRPSYEAQLHSCSPCKHFIHKSNTIYG